MWLFFCFLYFPLFIFNELSVTQQNSSCTRRPLCITSLICCSLPAAHQSGSLSFVHSSHRSVKTYSMQRLQFMQQCSAPACRNLPPRVIIQETELRPKELITVSCPLEREARPGCYYWNKVRTNWEPTHPSPHARLFKGPFFFSLFFSKDCCWLSFYSIHLLLT